MKPRSEYGKQVAHRLIDLDRNETWLVEQVKEQLTGRNYLYFDKQYLYKIMTNPSTQPPRILKVIEEVLCTAETQNLTSTHEISCSQ